MAIVGELLVVLGGTSAPLMATLAKSEAALKGFAATNAGTSASFAGIGLAAGLAGGAAVLGLGLAVKAAADFESQLNTINTIARLSPPALAEVGKGIRGIAVSSGSGLDDLTATFYNLLSVGVPLANAMDVLGDSVTLSLGGLGTVDQAATAITGAINAWSDATGSANLTMADSAKVMDAYAKGIELGDIKTKDFPAAMANVASMAAQFNTPMQEVIASLALMSTKFIDPTQGATAMNAAFTALQRVPPGMEKLQHSTGKAYEQIARTQGMHEAMMQIVADAKKYSVNLVDVFGRTDALPYVFSTTGAAADQFGSFLGQVWDSYGTGIGQANERTQGFNFQMGILGAKLNDLAISVGTALLPPLTDLVGALSDGVTWLGQMGDTIRGNEAVMNTLANIGDAISDSFVAAGPKIQEVIVALQQSIDFAQKAAEWIGTVVGGTPTGGQQGPGRGGAGVEPTPFLDTLQWPLGPVNTPKLDIGPFKNVLGGDSGVVLPHKNVHSYATGGIVPGTGPRLIVAHGGEEVRRPGQATQLTAHFHVEIGGEKIGEWIERRLFNDASIYSSGFSTSGPTGR